MAVARTVRGNRIPEVCQCRVVPDLGPKMKDIPVNYDSSVVFPSEELAMAYFPLYIRTLTELGLLKKDQVYETAIVTLTIYDQEPA